MHSLKMLGVHKQPREFILIALKSEKHTQPHVVYSALHGSVHGLGVIVIIVLGAGGMKLEIAFFVVGLLEKNICSDSLPL